MQRNFVARNPLSLRLELAFCVVLLAVALATRLYAFWEVPYSGFVDIGAHAHATLQLLEREAPSPWQLGWGNVPSFYWYTLAPFFALVGWPILAQKIAVLTFSLVALVLTYFFLRDLFGNLFALLGVGCLVFSRYFLFYSRYPMEPMDLYMFYAASLWTFRRGLLAEKRRTAYPLISCSALFLACGQHIYLSSRFLVPVLAAYFAVLYFRTKDRKATLRRGLLFAGVFLLLVAPLTYEYLTHPTSLYSRHQEIGAVGKLSASGLVKNYATTFLFFIHKGDPYPCQNVPHLPMVHPGIVVLFLSGLLAALLLIRREPAQIALIAFFFCLPATSLTLEPLNSKRLLNAMLGLSLFVAYGPAYVVARWRSRTRAVWAVPLVAALLLAGFGLYDFKRLFVDFARNPMCLRQSGYHQVQYALEVLKASKTSHVYLSKNRRGPQGSSYHPHEGVLPFDPVRHIPLGDVAEKNVTIFLEPESKHLLPLFNHFYPSAKATERDLGHGYTLMRYDIPRGEINGILGASIERYRQGESDPYLAYRDPWAESELAVKSVKAEETIQVSGMVYLEDRLRLRMWGRGTIELTLDGDVLPAQRLDGGGLLVTRPGPAGWRSWTLTFHADAGNQTLILSPEGKPLRFVSAHAPRLGQRQITFEDLVGNQMKTLATVPKKIFYDRWTGHTDAITAFCGEFHVDRPGFYQVEFQSEADSRLCLPDLLNERLEPKTKLTRRLRLEPGEYPYFYLVDMRSERPPHVRFEIVPADRADRQQESVQWTLPTSSLLQLWQSIRSAGGFPIEFGDYSIIDYRQGWGDLQIDKNVRGKPLRVAGKEYTQGLGTHAPSSIRLRLKQPYRTFSGTLALDDGAGEAGSIQMWLKAGKVTLFESPVLNAENPSLSFSIPLEGAAEIDLIVGDGGDGNPYDHADWLDLRFEP